MVTRWWGHRQTPRHTGHHQVMTGQSYLHVPVSKTAMYNCELQYQLQSLIQCTNWNLYVNINIKDIVVHPALSLPSSAGPCFPLYSVTWRVLTSYKTRARYVMILLEGTLGHPDVYIHFVGLTFWGWLQIKNWPLIFLLEVNPVRLFWRRKKCWGIWRSYCNWCCLQSKTKVMLERIVREFISY